jgi:hypothetical protein
MEKTVRAITEISQPKMIPMIPPRPVRAAASIRLDQDIRFLAPMALRMPISKVRSVTETTR